MLELTEDRFDEIVLKSEIPVLIDFWSPTCAPCRALVPILDALARTNEDEALIAKVNVFDCPNVAQKYGVSSLPTIMIFNEGKVVERMLGVQSQEKLQEAIDEVV